MKSKVYQRGAAGVEANMTPMIDVVFLLIIFFMLVSQIQRARLLELELPEIENAAAATPPRDSVLVINIVPGAGDTGAYRLGTLEFNDDLTGRDALVRHLVRERERRTDPVVLVRADRTEPYERVHPVLQAVSEAGLARVHLLTLSEEIP